MVILALEVNITSHNFNLIGFRYPRPVWKCWKVHCSKITVQYNVHRITKYTNTTRYTPGQSEIIYGMQVGLHLHLSSEYLRPLHICRWCCHDSSEICRQSDYKFQTSIEFRSILVSYLCDSAKQALTIRSLCRLVYIYTCGIALPPLCSPSLYSVFNLASGREKNFSSLPTSSHIRNWNCCWCFFMEDNSTNVFTTIVKITLSRIQESI